MATTRRSILRVAALLGVAVLITTRPWARYGADTLSYQPLPDLPPLRRIADAGAGASAPAQDILLGLDVPGAPTPPDLPEIAPGDVCRLLHLPWRAGDPVPVTYFTDIRCPVCRTLERDLARLRRDDPALFKLHTREFPVFGPRSEAAARLILAAAGQGAAEDMRTHLQTRPAPNTGDGVTAMAATIGLDPGALQMAWQSDDVASRLAEDRALARRLGLRGTPGLVIGRTVVPGAVPRETLLSLIEAEKDAPPLSCDAA